MTREMRYWINTAVCGLVLAHAIYWFVAGNAATASSLRTSLVVAQAVLGAIGVVWFWRRARQTA